MLVTTIESVQVLFPDVMSRMERLKAADQMFPFPVRPSIGFGEGHPLYE